MKNFPERKRNRLENYDYSLSGGYFITICTKNRIPWFGEIIDRKMQLGEVGQFAKECWHKIPELFPNVVLDQFVVMPDHVHGIIFINNNVGAEYFPPTKLPGMGRCDRPLQKTNLSSVVRGFKTGVTKKCSQSCHQNFTWQRSFHDHIIRDEESLDRVRNYIIYNPENSK